MSKKKITGGKRQRGIFKNNKKNEPLITVIMVCLNSQKHLTKSINSVLKQTYKNFELIIIDGGSTDNTLKILKKNNNKIDFWISEKDKSHFDAMNKGIKLSRGSIISILNSDDVYYINALKTAAKYFKITPEIFFNLYSKYLKRAEEFIEVEPDLPETYNNLGLNYAAGGNLEKATKYFQLGLQTSPTYATLYQNLSTIYAARAIAAYRKALLGTETVESVGNPQASDLLPIEMLDKR